MSKTILLAASFYGATAVMLGAFGAHGLKPHLGDYGLEIYQKGVEYQFVHALLLLAIGVISLTYPSVALRWSASFTAVGMLLFSGSLYLLATRSLLGIESFSKFLGPITPIGGSFLIVGWILLGVHIYKNIG